MGDPGTDDVAATHCEWCGAEFDATATPGRPQMKATTSAPSTGGEPATHCEWCGAAYPVPGEEP
jgi:hypothetical protein